MCQDLDWLTWLFLCFTFHFWTGTSALSILPWHARTLVQRVHIFCSGKCSYVNSCSACMLSPSVMSNSLHQPHGLWPHQAPWSIGYPSKDTGGGCHFSFSRGSSQPRTEPCFLCLLLFGRPVLTSLRHLKPLPSSIVVANVSTYCCLLFSRKSCPILAILRRVTHQAHPHLWDFSDKNSSWFIYFFLQGSYNKVWTCVQWLAGGFFVTELTGSPC